MFTFPQGSPETVIFFEIVSSKFTPKKADVISISAIRVSEKLGIVDSFHSLLRPKNFLSPDMEDITELDNETLSKAPSAYSTLKDLVIYLKDDLIINSDPEFTFKVLLNQLQKNKLTQPAAKTLHLFAATQKVHGKSKFDQLIENVGDNEKLCPQTSLRKVYKSLDLYLSLLNDSFWVDENVYSLLEWHYD
jgi:DNA polymerase III alpha subunit (gram-positive type)